MAKTVLRSVFPVLDRIEFCRIRMGQRKVSTMKKFLAVVCMSGLCLSVVAQQGKQVVYKGPGPAYRSDLVSDRMEGGVRILTVKVSGPITSAQAKEIAADFSSKHPGEGFEIRMFMSGTETMPGKPWAVSKVGPGGAVELVSHSVEKVETDEKPDDGRVVVGKWGPSDGTSEEKAVLFEKDGKTFLELTDEEGNAKAFPVTTKKTSTGVKIERMKGGEGQGEHFLLNAFGDLEERDDTGRIRKLERGDEKSVPLSASRTD
jgi:hypothetical protein